MSTAEAKMLHSSAKIKVALSVLLLSFFLVDASS
jgi:hypothetical protein